MPKTFLVRKKGMQGMDTVSENVVKEPAARENQCIRQSAEKNLTDCMGVGKTVIKEAPNKMPKQLNPPQNQAFKDIFPNMEQSAMSAWEYWATMRNRLEHAYLSSLSHTHMIHWSQQHLENVEKHRPSHVSSPDQNNNVDSLNDSWMSVNGIVGKPGGISSAAASPISPFAIASHLTRSAPTPYSNMKTHFPFDPEAVQDFYSSIGKSSKQNKLISNTSLFYSPYMQAYEQYYSGLRFGRVNDSDKGSTNDISRPLFSPAQIQDRRRRSSLVSPLTPLAPTVELINGGYGIKNPLLVLDTDVGNSSKSQEGPSGVRCGQYRCKVCGLAFEFPKLLQRHLKTHADVKRYLCTFCGKGFNDTFDLKRHTRTHTGVRPYKCEKCDKAFTQRCSLESHCRKIHGTDFRYGYKERRGKVYVCEECGHVTNDPEQHFMHIKERHPYNTNLLRCFYKRQFKHTDGIAPSSKYEDSAASSIASS